MSKDRSEAFERRLRFPRFPYLHLLIAARPWVDRSRTLRRAAFVESTPERRCLVRCSIPNELERASEHFQREGWTFIPQFLDPAFHEQLIAHWPGRMFFKPPKTVFKGYDIGFHWRYGDSGPYDLAPWFPEVQELRECLTSPETHERVQAFTGWAHETK